MAATLFGLLVVLAAGAWLLRRAGVIGSGAASPYGRSGSGFLVRFRDGRLVEARGVVPRAACRAFEDLALEVGLEGDVKSTADGGIAFSDTIPEGARQQLRNVWFASLGR